MSVTVADPEEQAEEEEEELKGTLYSYNNTRRNVRLAIAHIAVTERAEMVPHQRERHDYANCAPCVMIGCLAC